MANKYILALDQGTTSSRSIIVNEQGNIVAMEQQEFTQIFPESGWVEHDPKEILESQLATLKKVLKKANVSPTDIVGLGITNQRETTIVWNKNTGRPIYNAIVWQDKRTANRKKLEILPANSFAKVEFIQPELFKLHNRFQVSFFEGNTLFDKTFLFEKNTIKESSLNLIPQLKKRGILAE